MPSGGDPTQISPTSEAQSSPTPPCMEPQTPGDEMDSTEVWDCLDPGWDLYQRNYGDRAKLVSS